MTTLHSTEAGAGYYQQAGAPRALRAALAVTQKLWPALAVTTAYRLFGTPLPLKWRQRQAPTADGSVASWPFERASITVYEPLRAPGSPVALLVHGWGGHAGDLLPMAAAVAAAGLRPVLLEMPAHGRSAGVVSNLPQFTRAIEYAAGRLRQRGDVIAMLAGHSLGASAAALAASRGVDAARLLLLAPPASPRAFTFYFARVFGLSETVRAAMQERIEAREAVLMQQFEPAAVGPRIRIPTLVVHDRGDRVNAFADGQAYVAAIEGARLLATEGLGHRRLLRDQTVLRQITDFATH